MPSIKLGWFHLGVFVITVFVMFTYESAKEWIFHETLSPWESHAITIIVTAFVALIASSIAHHYTLRKIRSAQDAENRAHSFVNTLLDSIPIAVFYKDLNGRYLGCNPTFTQTMGVTEQEIRGKTVYELWPGKLAETYHRKDMELIEHQGSQCYEFQLKDKQGRMRDVIYSKAVFHDEHGNVAGIIGSFFDISEQKQAEQQLKEYQEHLESMIYAKTNELQRKNADLETAMLAANAANRAKSLFLGNISHELRTPMNAIFGFTQLLNVKLNDPQYLNLTRSILDSSNHMLKLIDNLLELSTCEAFTRMTQTTELNFSELFDAVLRPWQKSSETKGLILTSDIDPALPSGAVHMDAERLSQILWHFLDNAFKFSEQGNITLRALFGESSEDQLEVRFEVEDQGIGITPDQQVKIFQPFEQADNSTTRRYKGAGLGLAICKQLSDAMDGMIGVESTLGEGSKFWVSLPVKVANV